MEDFIYKHEGSMPARAFLLWREI